VVVIFEPAVNNYANEFKIILKDNVGTGFYGQLCFLLLGAEKVLMSNTITTVSILELKRLLTELAEHGNNVCVRFRLIGELWQPHHHRVLKMTETGVALVDEPSNKLVFISNLTNVMQFELDSAFQIYQPNYHYSVTV
jgi:hypothetical protein